VIWSETDLHWHEAGRMLLLLLLLLYSGCEGGVGEVVMGGGFGSHGARPPSLVSSTCRWCHCSGILEFGASMMVPVATSHDQSSGGADGEGRVVRKMWHPHVEQKYRVDAGDAE
jgi:hypothetical protein